jgi:hypothetical protein
MVQDMCFLLMPIILTLVAVLWFFRYEWVPSRLESVLVAIFTWLT